MALGALSLTSCYVPVDATGQPVAVAPSVAVGVYPTIPVGVPGDYYFYGGRYYYGGYWAPGRYYYGGRWYHGRYVHGGHYYYGGRMIHHDVHRR